ncbi:MAG: MBL fold metallo-hydrolase [Bacilli bacterium]|nr:MBL fold metallo-hydrolase [Bacilli bacterium]
MDKKTTIILIIVLFVILIIAGIICYLLNYKVNKLNVYFFNAGKADSALITFEDKHILIDTGEEEFYDKLNLYLNSNKINKIDYLILTHFDKDHIGSASKIIDNYEVSNIYITNTTKDSTYYNNYLESIKKKNITPIKVEGDLDISIGELQIIINGPTKIYEEDVSNNSSLITSIKYKYKSFLFMGDAQNDRIQDYLNDHKGTYDVLKLPYHGNFQKNDKKLIEDVRPKYIVISSNIYEDKLIDYLDSKRKKYYKTGDDNISISSNGYFLKFDKLK